MSSYNCYKFKSFDRPLTKEEKKEVSSWSSRAKVSSTAATFTYSYGSFRKKPEKVIEDYFDAMIYFSSWSIRQLLLRIPQKLVDFQKLKRFTTEGSNYDMAHLSIRPNGDDVIINCRWQEEEGGGEWLEEEDYEVEDFEAIRSGIINGDYRALYLFWLKLEEERLKKKGLEKNDDDDDYYRILPAVPPNLGKRDESIRSFMEFFSIEKDLAGAAQQFSESTATIAIDHQQLLHKLEEEEKDAFLKKLLQGEANVALQLRKRLEKMLPSPEEASKMGPDINTILAAKSGARTLREAREAKAAREAHRVKMEKVRREAAQYWKTVHFNLERKSGKSYDIATEALRDLQDAAAFFGTIEEFKPKMRAIRDEYGGSLALKRRFNDAKLLW